MRVLRAAMQSVVGVAMRRVLHDTSLRSLRAILENVSRPWPAGRRLVLHEVVAPHVVDTLRTTTNHAISARAQTPLLPLFLRHLEPLATPQTMHPLAIRHPAVHAKQRPDATIAASADVARQAPASASPGPARRRAPCADIVASIVAVSTPCMPGVRTPPCVPIAPSSLPRASAPGSPFSLEGLVQNLLVQRQVGHRLLQPAVFDPQPLQSLRIVALRPAVQVTPR